MSSLPATASARRAARADHRGGRRDVWLAAALVAPVLLWLGATLLYPLIDAVVLSVQDVGVIGTAGHFVGLANYGRVLGDADFWLAVWRSAVWIVGNAVVQTALALVTALVLAEEFPGVRLARVWVIITWIVPTIVVVIIWRWLLSTSGGMINPLLIELGLIRRPVGFFATGPMSMATLILINSWRWFPFVAIMFLAGLQRIPLDVYEAAAVDGATGLQRLVRITWPLLQPTVFVLTVIGTLLSFTVFDIVWLLTGGGPSDATTTLPVLIYRTAFKGYRLSEAAAMSVVATLLLMGFALLAIRELAPKAQAE
jgi:multiple sugar transport system permease protein